jgi:hypothetical protein
MAETQVDMLAKLSTVHRRLEEWKGLLQAVELHEGPRDVRRVVHEVEPFEVDLVNGERAAFVAYICRVTHSESNAILWR